MHNSWRTDALAASEGDEAVVFLQGWWHCILYVLFENAMGIVKLWAVIAGEGLSGTRCACSRT